MDRPRERDRARYSPGNFNNPDFHQQQRRPSRFSDGPPPENRRSPDNFRGGFAGGGGVTRRAFESPPHQPPPTGPGTGFRPVGGGGTGGFGNDFKVLPPLSGQKRGFPSSNRDGSPERFDGKSFVKVFVGSVPRTATEEEIRPLFEEQGKVLEVALIKDRRTGQQQGCCFIKYATSEEADRAIRALHNQYTLPGGIGPIQVRYADGERERIGNGAVEYKLFVGSLNKLATEKEVEEIFLPYGRVEDVYLMRDEKKLSRGCGFVKFSSKDSAMAAISALNGIFMMRGCDQPLTVRFADPKRPRAGEQRTNPAFGGPGFGPVPPPGIRPAPGPNFSGSMGGRGPPHAWQPMSPQSLGPSPNANIHGFGNQFPPRSVDAATSSALGGHLGPQGSQGSVTGSVSASSASPKNYNQSFPQAPPSSQQISSLQKPLASPQHFPTSLQPHQGPGTYFHPQTSQASVRPPNQLQTGGGQGFYSQGFAAQQAPPGLTGQSPSAQFQVQQNAPSAMAQQSRPSINQEPNTSSAMNAHLPAPVPQQPVPFQQSPSSIAQMLSQQTQTLQATYQSSQQAISQLQQQVQLMQPSNQTQHLQQNYQTAKSQWAGVAQTTAATTPAAGPAPAVAATPTPAPVNCNWTEHTSPDGYKYYYNSVTNESRWVKPEELTQYEQQQQQQKVSVQQPQNQPNVLPVPTQQVNQSQPPQLQAQYHQYQAPRGVANQTVQNTAYAQQTPANSMVDPSRFQQGFQATQDWGWKANSGGGT